MSDLDVVAAPTDVEEGTLDGGIFYRHWPVANPRAVAILVHGLGEHSGRYQHVADALAARDIAAIAPDHLGHGRSPGLRCHIRRFSDFFGALDAVRAVVDERYPGVPCFIVGHSMGGLIAGAYLLERQDRFHGAVFSGAAFEVPQPPGAFTLAMYKLLAAVLPRLGAMQLDDSGVSRDPEVVRRYREDPLVHDGKTSAGLLVALLTTAKELEARRGALTLPVLVLHGEGDVMTPPHGSQNFIEAVGSKDKTLRIYPELYHEIFNEPEQAMVLGDMLDWLDAHIPAAE